MQFAYKSKNISYFYLKTGTNIRENFFSIDNTMLDVYFFIYLGNFKIFRSAKGQHFLLEKVSKSQPFYGQDSCRYPARRPYSCLVGSHAVQLAEPHIHVSVC